MATREMHKTIIRQANEMGYFPTVTEADAVWKEISLRMAALDSAAAKRPKSEELTQVMREAIEHVLSGRAAQGTPRVETGVVTLGDDRAGVFIRWDHAAMLARDLRETGLPLTADPSAAPGTIEHLLASLDAVAAGKPRQS